MSEGFRHRGMGRRGSAVPLPFLALALVLLSCGLLGPIHRAHAEDGGRRRFDLRISFKRVLPASPGTPTRWSHERIRRMARAVDAVLRREARIGIVVTEVVDVVDPLRPHSWYRMNVDDFHALEDAARTGIVDMAWRSDAVNVMLVGSFDDGALAGFCSFPPAEEMIAMITYDDARHDGDAVTLAHELGHYLGLLHVVDETYGRDEPVDCRGRSPTCAFSGDLVCDTPPASEDDEVTERFYRSCGAKRRQILGRIRRNLMSYAFRSIAPATFTRGQVARMRAFARASRAAVIDGPR